VKNLKGKNHEEEKKSFTMSMMITIGFSGFG